MYKIWYVDTCPRHEQFLNLAQAQNRWDALSQNFHMLSTRP